LPFDLESVPFVTREKCSLNRLLILAGLVPDFLLTALYSAEGVEELLDRLARSGDVSTFEEPRLEVTGVENTGTSREPTHEDTLCEEPEEEFVFPHRGIVRQRCKRCLRFLASPRCNGDDKAMKRTTSVTVKMTAEDFALLQKAADTIWPKAVLTRSSVVLGLARIGAESVMASRSTKTRKK
jgi:hypothetical protein